MSSSNEKREFRGTFIDISPILLVGEGEDDLGDFFLVLSVIYNDLKGLLTWQKNIEEKYRMAPSDEKSVHAAELAGLQVQHYKILTGLIREFLAFLKKNADVLKSSAFQLILLKVDKTNKKLWDELVQIALDDDVETKSTFAYSLMLIRNNVGFHYDQSRKELRRSFHSFFNRKPKTKFNDRAYYSLGNTMNETRFYYADAAVKEYIAIKAEEVKGHRNQESMSFEEHFNRLVQMVGGMNHTLETLLRHYFEFKRKQR